MAAADKADPDHRACADLLGAVVGELRTSPLVIAISERLGETSIATLDHRHFNFVRPAHASTFELVP